MTFTFTFNNAVTVLLNLKSRKSVCFTAGSEGCHDTRKHGAFYTSHSNDLCNLITISCHSHCRSFPTNGHTDQLEQDQGLGLTHTKGLHDIIFTYFIFSKLYLEIFALLICFHWSD